MKFSVKNPYMHSIYTYLATDLTTDFFIRNVLSVPDLLKTKDSRTTTQSKCEYNNRPFPSSLLPLFQNESKCETFHMKMSFTHKSIRMQIILIFI